MKHSHKKRRSTSSSSSSHSTQSENDYGRYKRVKQAPQVAEIPVQLQPAEPINITPNLPENVLQTAKDSGSDSVAEVWSFDRAVNEVLGFCQKNYAQNLHKNRLQSNLSGIEHIMESHATPLYVLSQSKLVENTTKFIQNKLDTDKCCKDWICPQNLVTSLAPTKFYKSQKQYFPAENIPSLEADTSL